MTAEPELAQFALRRRLVVLILIPLAIAGLVNVWVDLRAAGSASRLQDEQLTRLMPLFANAVLSARSDEALSDSMVMLVPELHQFLTERADQAGFRVSRMDGQLLAGDERIGGFEPLSYDLTINTQQRGGAAWRVTAQRIQFANGQDLVLQLADGSDARQRWLATTFQRVVLPHLLLALAVYLAVRWGVKRALQPLVDLRHNVEQRAAQDLSPIDAKGVPQEVSPLVRALNRLFANAKYQADAQRRFVADAAHQLRTPLAALQMEVQALATGAPRTGGQVSLPAEAVLRLEQATRRASTLAHQLLTLSRAEDDTAQTALEPLRLLDLVQDVLALRLDEALARQADLGADLAGELSDAWVLAQPWLLRELLLNLLDNALRYSPAPAVVTLGARVAGNTHVDLYVADNGPGVPEAERALVLERFYRAKGNAVEGNGLGLAIAQEIAQRHGSSLTLQAANPAAASPGLQVGLRLSLVRAPMGAVPQSI
jgi:two-component system, OmpR family, sensor histidine kinase TctE